MQQEVRFLQWASAQESIKSLLTSRKSALERLHYYQRLLGRPADPNAPDTLPLSFEGLDLNEATFAVAYNELVEQYDKLLTLPQMPTLPITGDTSPIQQSGASGQGSIYLNRNEDAEINTHSPTAQDNRDWASRLDMTASTLASIPGFSLKMHFWGLGAAADIPLGTILSNAARAVSSHFSNDAQSKDRAGQNASKTGSYQRRADEWFLQHNLAAHELMQIGRQILTSLIAEQIAHHEYVTIKQQIANAQEVDRFLHEKFSNEELYAWMQGEIARLYYEYYRFAFDTARKAEQALKRELMRPEVGANDYVKFNYWDGGRKGLLSGEALYLDVKRMELAYHENNKREYELTRHVSLRQLNPTALLAFRATGSCQVTIPEWVFDLDTPGHYMRRIKTVGITIPCVSGPYTSVSCTLTLTKSSLRTSPLVGDGYARQGSEENRFVDYFSATQSIVTSSGQNDSGLFETNLRDERFLPFEGAGAESTWKLELPADFRQFAYDTISDVILHIRYTAREGGAQLRSAAVAQLRDLVAGAGASALGPLVSLRHDFPTEWSAFVNGTGNFTATLRKDYFPYLVQSKTITITGFELYGLTDSDPPRHHSVGDTTVWDAATSALSDQQAFTFTAAVDAPGPAQVLTPSTNAEIFLIVRYTL